MAPGCGCRLAAAPNGWLTDDDLGYADLTLPDTPSPDDTSVDLLVHERACASGHSAEARIELDEPLGDREIVDALMVPPHPVTVDVAGETSGT